MAFDAPRRPLVYPLKNQLSLSAETPEGETIESDFIWATEDNDERVLITLELSLNEYIVLASSIDVGSDIAYGSDATAVWWLWAKAYRMSICEQIIQCINENEATRAALVTLINSTFNENLADGQPIPEIVQLANLFDKSVCSNDQMWGNALSIVQFANRRTQDLIETLEAATNNQEGVALLVGAIPVLETLPVDEFFQIYQKFAEWLGEAYFAGYDVDYELERACDLFCMLQRTGDCVLSYQDIATYFIDRARGVSGFTNAFDSAITIIEALANWTEQTGEVVADVMFGVQFGFLGFLSSAFGAPFAAFKQSANIGIPTSAWEGTCEGCGWSRTANFNEIDGGFAPTTGEEYGEWSNGWYATNAIVGSFARRGINISLDIDATRIVRVEIGYTLVKGDYDPNPTVAAFWLLSGSVVKLTNNTELPDGVNIDVSWTGDVGTATQIRIGMNASVQPSSNPVYSGSVSFQYVTVQGLEDVPSQFDGWDTP